LDVILLAYFALAVTCLLTVVAIFGNVVAAVMLGIGAVIFFLWALG
jgi:hypothetical protein